MKILSFLCTYSLSFTLTIPNSLLSFLRTLFNFTNNYKYMILLLLGYLCLIGLFYIEYRFESSRLTTTLQTSADDRGTTRLLILSYFLSIFVAPLWLLLFSTSLAPNFAMAITMPTFFGWLGLSVMVLSLILLYWATFVNPFYLRALATTDDHFICTDGPYQYIRHPGYLAFMLAWIGFAFVTQNWISFGMITVLMTWVYVLRIRAEEQMMLDRFGVDYQQYINETRRLIPVIY
ncbi:hypothetical protein BDF20DRAFT_281514 [Mycotypha africana]|uniref:uncharacterized protein n=1 Tax=Mycotypha africana TaxID=64632 RepID=UPI002301CB4C|nr:uncharacterized protein BDF20DRAFT_281514 [Mycotypha africana]KAI8987662.1 hypothetical protein BDF20DRAFT_281514 [Mycotypha africana]